MTLTSYFAGSSALWIIVPVESEMARSLEVPPISTVTRRRRPEGVIGPPPSEAFAQIARPRRGYRPLRETRPDRRAAPSGAAYREHRACPARSRREGRN